MDHLVKSKVSNDDSVGGNRRGMTLRASTTGHIDTSSPGSDEIGLGSSVMPMARIQTSAPPPFIPQKNDSKRQPGNVENHENGTPSKKARQQTSSGVSRPPLSPIKCKNAKDSNDLVEETRKVLVELSGSRIWLTSYSSGSITIALGDHGNDPKLAANYILSLLCQEVNTDAPSVSIVISNKTIASETHSSIEMLSKYSAARPSGDKVALGVVKDPKKNVHYFEDNKLCARAKAFVRWDKEFGEGIEEFDGTCDLDKQLKRLAKAEGMDVSLVEVDPDDNGWTPSQRCGKFAKCEKCSQEFACMQQDEQNPCRRDLAYHKRFCGKTVCACGATKDQLRDKFRKDSEAEKLGKTFQQISVSATNHFKNCTIKASDMLDFNQRFLENIEWERNKLPPSLGIPNKLLKEKSEEECKRLKREFTRKKMTKLYNWMDKRLRGESWVSTDTYRKLEDLGHDMENVIVCDF